MIRECYERIYTPNWKNLTEIEKFLEVYRLPKVSKQGMENLNRPITNNKIKLIIKDLSTKKSPCPDDIIGESIKYLKKK